MHFTNEEKEIIKNIAKKDRYTLNDFCEHYFPYRETIELKEGYYSNLNICSVSVSNNLGIYLFDSSYKEPITKFLYLWKLLIDKNFAVELEIIDYKVSRNVRNFFELRDNKYTFSNDCRYEYHEFWCKEIMILESKLQEFINDGFKTKDELRIEDEIKARNEALKDAKKSFKISVFLAILSVLVSVIPLFKDDKVIVKNQVNTQQLEAQLKQTNQELKDIKTKFEELQKQTQKPLKK